MRRQVYKQDVYALLDKQIEGASLEDKMDAIRELLVDYQREHDNQYDTSNKGKPWDDKDLVMILSNAPTKENCSKFAFLFEHGYGSIEQIYCWAATPSNKLEEKGRAEDAFVLQVKKIAKRLHLRT